MEQLLEFTYIYICHTVAACGILVPRPGIEPGAPAVKALSPNRWTAREFPRVYIYRK